MLQKSLKRIISQKLKKMNIALVGYGRMGHEIESAALSRRHSIVLIVDKDNFSDLNAVNLAKADVVIEFSQPEVAYGNVIRCLEEGIPVVSGTTGWMDKLGEAAEKCLAKGTSFIHSTNFSIGVNILFRLNSELARLMAGIGEYKVSIEEIHHTRKLDAPSGTAITLASGIAGNHRGYEGWTSGRGPGSGAVPIESVREGDVPGTHTIVWESDVDSISLKHEARNRKGLALGAVVAAEYIYNRKGVFTMSDVLGF